MKPTNLRKTLTAAALIGAAALGTVAVADPQGGYGPGYGPGMMGGYGPGYGMGPGMMGGYGPGYGGGYGPGMMYGYGMGPGMMYGYGPGYGMGPGMMWGYGHGYGMGPGMMWGYGPGYGGGAGPALNLSDEQRSKIGKIQEDLWRKQWELMGKMQEEYARGSDADDDAAAQKTYKNIADLRQKMFNNSLAARKQMDAVLTKEQREQLRRR